MNTSDTRLYVVDALRGFAIVSIMLLHNIEHFDFYFFPENLPDWMVHLDKGIWKTLFFLFSNKSYSIFAFLFGLTFFIQSNNQKKKGKDFSGRFAWRMFLLFAFGMVNSLFYAGDILTFYAVLGLFLIPLSRLKSNVLWMIGVILVLQPVEWFNLFYAIQHPNEAVQNPASWAYWGRLSYLSEGNLWEMMHGNITNGKVAVLLWNWEESRYFTIIALFIGGYIAGRKGWFVSSETSTKFWKRVLLISSLSFGGFYCLRMFLPGMIESEAIERVVMKLVSPWSDLPFTAIWISGITLLFQKKFFHRILQVFIPFGKMSLSNYVMQSLLGSFIYYHYGLGMFQYTGATYSFLIGIGLILLTGIFCTWWAKHFKHGPLEAVWHKLTWIGRK